MSKTVAAFAAGDGGIMVFGIDPDELTVTGLDGEDPKRLRDRLHGLVHRTVVPSPDVTVEDHQVDGETILVLHVAPTRAPIRIAADKGSRDKPEFCVRRGSSTYPAQPGELREAARTPPGAQREPRPPDPVRPLVSARTASPSRSRERRRPVVMADQHLCGQHKTNTTPCSGKDQHANNTDKTVLPGT